MNASIVCAVLGALALSAPAAAAGAPAASGAESVLQTMIRTCPNRTALASAERKADEADAVDDATRYALHRSAARQFYRCSLDHPQRLYRDYARYMYIAQMAASLGSPPESVSDLRGRLAMVRQLQRSADELSASTPTPRIKTAAKSLAATLKDGGDTVEAQIKKLEADGAP